MYRKVNYIVSNVLELVLYIVCENKVFAYSISLHIHASVHILVMITLITYILVLLCSKKNLSLSFPVFTVHVTHPSSDNIIADSHNESWYCTLCLLKWYYHISTILRVNKLFEVGVRSMSMPFSLIIYYVNSLVYSH